MGTLLTLLTIIFVAMVLVTAVTFGFALLMWIMIVGAVLWICFLLRQAWWRWRFVHYSPSESPGIIEGDYKDISDQSSDNEKL